jgi:hypothetical protein
MRVYDKIWHDTFSGKWKIFLPICHSTSSFLTMTRCKFISDLWGLDGSCLNFDE